MGEPADLDAMTPAERARVLRLLLGLVSPPKARKARPASPVSASQSVGKPEKRRKRGGYASSTRDQLD
jgi:hypothetical protein